MKDYSDIINVVYRKSRSKKRMSISDRAAQFAPFAALTGHDDAIKETARLTEKRRKKSESELEALDRKLKKITEIIDTLPEITVEYFAADEKKEGGRYKRFTGKLRLVDEINREFIFKDGTKIDIDNITELI